MHTHTHTHTHQNKGDGSYSERVRAKWFCWAFQLGCLQLIQKGLVGGGGSGAAYADKK